MMNMWETDSRNSLQNFFAHICMHPQSPPQVWFYLLQQVVACTLHFDHYPEKKTMLVNKSTA